MAEKFDAASRLAEGMPSVDAVQNYVWACRMLGYEHPDLTMNAAQVREQYASEDGLNLVALDADCSALQAAATATEEALTRQDAQRVALMVGWRGRGAEASREFLRRHDEASALVATAVRTAAHGLAELRDKLWQSVDGKVATVTAIDERVHGQRADWLAAAHTVTTGAGDRAAASELVDQEIKPFVTNVIGGEWLTAMRAAVDAIGAAYDVLTAELASETVATFDVPSDLGPAWTPAGRDASATAPSTAPVGAVAPVAPVAPAAWSAPPAFSAPPADVPSPVAPLAAAPAAVDPAAAAPAAPAPPMPPLGGGLPDIGSGLTGFAQQLGEALGGLLGGEDGVLTEPEGIEMPELDEPAEVEDLDEDDELGDEEADELDDEAVAADAETACDLPPEDPVPQEDQLLTDEVDPAPAAPEALPPPIVASPPVAESAPPAAVGDAGTPCEIAADELPQVGE